MRNVKESGRAGRQRFFATTAKGLEAVLAAELRELGAGNVEETRAGVWFTGSLETAYRACLWSRVASRVLLPLASFPAATAADLYHGVRSIDWLEHLGPEQTLAVDCSSARSAIAHTHFAALKTKDAVVDQIRDRKGRRPSVRVDRPDLRINVYLHGDVATISLDLSGESLHRRGYRAAATPAPLKENLAAGILLMAGWPEIARAGGPFLDPMCGSGTFPIEAALIAKRIAPGRLRDRFGFEGWRGHDRKLWSQLREEARAGEIRAHDALPPIRGYDADRRAVRAAAANVARAGLSGRVHIECRPLFQSERFGGRPPGDAGGLLVTNPPYGERMRDPQALASLYAELGDVLRRRFYGWTAHVLTGNLALGRRIGLRPSRRHVLYNGAIECRLLVFPISPEPVRSEKGPGWRGTGG